ncbi:hypothetical protein KDA_29490 [Dictyobacter alpinus]|uniref:DinB-like domain-containing protein n=1 Tax=Dictyobacter alpinus TaxID=2014873 RepID=A0A402B7Y6_9CHLR|nr:DinB family protein [Dictyobacter alpinus]GCE27465.1 hypothetical protein KDA_29490 [Dictyobacter alpinus]
MSATETLENSHTKVIQALDDLPEAMWDMPGVSGDWSAKDVVAHLTSYELLLIDVLQAVQQGTQPSPYVLRWNASLETFNQEAVEARRYHTAQQVMNEYQDAQVRSTSELASLPPEMLERKGTMPWYRSGEASATELVERLGAHMNHHSEQIVQFREAHKDSE